MQLSTFPISIFHNDAELVEQVESWIRQKSQAYSAKTLALPAGGTPVPIYKKWEQRAPKELDHLRLMQLDEVASGKRYRMFQNFFKVHLSSFANRILSPLDEGPLDMDLAILGLGKNGHIAFHEPHIDSHFEFGEVKLSKKTIETLGLEGEALGMTYGLGAFNKCNAILLVVSGEGKAQALKSLVSGDGLTPAAKLSDHSDLSVLVHESNFKEIEFLEGLSIQK